MNYCLTIDIFIKFQRWRTVELEPMMQESAPIEDEHEIAPQEPLKRRRPGRKRKRRPHAEDTIHEHRMKDEQEFEDTFQSYYESESQVVYETTELPRRRRKRPEMRNNPSEDEVQEGQEVQRPTRRRGQRRRRPQNRENEDGLTVNEPHRPLQSGEEKTEERWNDHNNEGRYRMRPTEPKTHKIHLENYERPVRKQRISPEDRLFDDTQEEKSTSESEEMQPRVLLDITMTSTSTTESSSREVLRSLLLIFNVTIILNLSMFSEINDYGCIIIKRVVKTVRWRQFKRNLTT